MDTTGNQQTIAGSVAVEGFGYWSGRDVCVEFRPADPATGLVFVRGDLPGCPRILAKVENRTETPLRTTLQCAEAGVGMIEHIMAAVGGLGIDNCEIWADEAEMPGCDGSSLPFVEAIDSVGIVDQNVPRRRRIIRDFIRLGDKDHWIEARPSSTEGTILEYHLDYGPGNSIGRQTFQISLSPDSFRTELAPSRTFILKSEAEQVLANGLGQRTSVSDLLVFDDEGPIDNTLRFDNECVRHKLLDMTGDLALAGCELVGSFTAYRSGHRLNAELVRTLAADEGVLQHWNRCA